jgi:hypothetical protein
LVRSNQQVRRLVQQQLEQAAEDISSWQAPTLADDEIQRIQKSIQTFHHTTSRTDLTATGVDGSGEFPLLSFADTFVYLSLAQAVSYTADKRNGLQEVNPTDAVVGIAWLPEDSKIGPTRFDQALCDLVGEETKLQDIIERSDYRELKSIAARRRFSTSTLLDGLIRPHASDSGNIGIQLRSTAEFAAALRVIRDNDPPDYVLMDTTFSLPLLSSTSSLFYEHVKRLCCVEARQRKVAFFALSKSHGLSGMDRLETIASEMQGLASRQVAEHWHMRIPKRELDGWALSISEGKTLPPVGAMSYLVRFHRTTPVMRLDMDEAYWRENIQGTTEEKTRANEHKLFEDLDFLSHDVRSYGYPFPVKAAHDRASLTSAERLDYKKQATAVLVKQGMNPNLFRDPSVMTGHK